MCTFRRLFYAPAAKVLKPDPVSGVGWTEVKGLGRSEHSYKGLCPRPGCELQPCADKTVIVLLRGPRAPLPLLVIYHTWQLHRTIITLPLSPHTVMSTGASGAEGEGEEIAVRISAEREWTERRTEEFRRGERESAGEEQSSEDRV